MTCHMAAPLGSRYRSGADTIETSVRSSNPSSTMRLASVINAWQTQYVRRNQRGNRRSDNPEVVPFVLQFQGGESRFPLRMRTHPFVFPWFAQGDRRNHMPGRKQLIEASLSGSWARYRCAD